MSESKETSSSRIGGDTGVASVTSAPRSLKPSEVLARAADLIEPEGAWIQQAEARDEEGEAVDASARDATCWCALGAVWLAGRGRIGFMPSRVYLERHLGLYVDGPSPALSRVADWNDAPNRTQAEVVAALRKASELARSEGQ